MFTLAFIIGIFSYLIFAAGVFGLLYKNVIWFSTIMYALVVIYVLKDKVRIKNLKTTIDGYIIFFKTNKILGLSFILLSTQLLVNLIGVLGPEVSFDALWYHLELPKLFIQNHSVFHVPGNLLYYSDMPKLTEMLYAFALMLNGDLLAKLIHFLFGVLTLLAIYKVSRKFLPKDYSILAAVAFYSNLVVGWESITAYVDLSRTFFELLAFLGFIEWISKRKAKFILISGIMLGFAIATKIISASSLIIFAFLFSYDAYLQKENIKIFIKRFSFFLIACSLPVLPWFLFSFINTGNPVYPFFTTNFVNADNSFSFPNITHIFLSLYNFFLRSNDPISPIYLIVLPLIIIWFKKYDYKLRFLIIYSLISLSLWYLALQNIGSRFILPYLPVFSILAVCSIQKVNVIWLRRFLIGIIFFLSFVSVGYRTIANAKYIPVILGRETRGEFLGKHLNFSFGDFYDTEGYFKKNIRASNKVLLFGFHNLYYVDFPFIDSSWIKSGDRFNYIAVQNSNIPKRFSNWKEIYYNKLTRVRLYTLGRKMWAY